MTFSSKILIGLAVGVVTGLVFGDLVAPLKIAADGFVRLLQMTVLPYVTISIISSLGSLTLAQAKALGVRGGASGDLGHRLRVHLPHAAGVPPGRDRLLLQHHPHRAAAGVQLRRSVHSGEPVQRAGQQHRPGCRALLCDHWRRVDWRRAEAGVARRAAGRLHRRRARHAGCHTAHAVRPVRHRRGGRGHADDRADPEDPDLSRHLCGDGTHRLAVGTAGSHRSADGHTRARPVQAHPGSAAASAMPDVIVPVSFNFPHAGKLLSLSFIPFAAWYSDASLPADYPQLLVAGVLSFFGSLNSAVPFLSD